MRFVIVGGGPTGVELAGAMGELAHTTLRDDFRVIDTRSSEILLVEGSDRVLPTFQPGLSKRAEEALKRLGVTVRTRTRTTRISSGEVELSAADGSTKETVPTRTVFWAAGMKPSGLGRILASKTGAELDRIGRVIVTSDLTVPGHPEIFVIGDLAHFRGPSGEPLPGIAPVAMQEGRFAAAVIEGRLRGRTTRPFRYRDKGVLAVIGRNAAVAQFGRRGFSGRLAWLLWLFVHIWYLIAYDNKILVLVQWAFHYLTRGRGVRLVTGESVSGESETSGYV
jgi:NADH dehydrogenase